MAWDRRAVMKAHMTVVLLCLGFAAGLGWGGQAYAQSAYHAVQAQDARVQSIGWRLQHGNRAFCARTRPMSGLQLQDLDDYGQPDEARRALGITGPIAVQAVAASSPAERTGLRANQQVTAIGGATVEQIMGSASGSRRVDRLHDAILAGAAQPLEIVLGDGTAVSLTAEPVCDTRVEMHLRGSLRAMADGNRVVVFKAVVDATPDDAELSAVLAHELAHNILGHPSALDATGREVRRVRATEIEADRLAVWLMANAGYDPAAAVRFWQRMGRRIDHGILTAPTHLRWRSRVRLLEAEIAALSAVDPASGLRDWRPAFAASLASAASPAPR